MNGVLLTIELILSVGLGLGLTGIGAEGGAWILGGIAAGAIAVYLAHHYYGMPITPNRQARQIGQLLVGVSVGFSIHHSDITLLLPHLPIFVMLIAVLLLSSVVIGLIYARLAQLDGLTAMLATIPGNIGVMSSIAADYGRNTPQVSLVQLMRFTTVTLVVPLVAHYGLGIGHPHSSLWDGVGSTSLTFNLAYAVWLILVLGLAAIATRIGQRCHIPVAALLCSIVVGMGIDPLLSLLPFSVPPDWSLPPALTLLGQMLLGITVGEYWAINPRVSRRAIAWGTVPVMLTFLAGAVAASLAMLLTPWDWLTCLLVAAPGGSPEMIWLALVLDHNVEVVTTGHLLRIVAINASLPLFIGLAQVLEARTSPVPNSGTVS